MGEQRDSTTPRNGRNPYCTYPPRTIVSNEIVPATKKKKKKAAGSGRSGAPCVPLGPPGRRRPEQPREKANGAPRDASGSEEAAIRGRTFVRIRCAPLEERIIIMPGPPDTSTVDLRMETSWMTADPGNDNTPTLFEMIRPSEALVVACSSLYSTS